MSTFNPERLSVEFMEPTTPTERIIPRRYTLTNSDSTGALFLTIGMNVAWWKVNSLHDEVLGEWKQSGSILFFDIYVYIDQGEYPLSSAEKRYEIFRRELPFALNAIRYGDKTFFETHPFLDQAPIVVNFISSYPGLTKQEVWGNFQQNFDSKL